MDRDLFNRLLEDSVALTKRPKDILDPIFPLQSNFIRAPEKRKQLWCTRRSAKSYTAGLYLHQTAIDYSECNCLYIGLTRASAKAIIWKDVLLAIDKRHNLQTVPNKSELTITHPNGSIIYITGIDAEEDEMQKLLGKKWKLVIIDEGQSYSVDLRALVYGILGPAMIDQGGTICLMGTSGNMTQGLFYDITQGTEPGWKLFEWTAFDNPYVARQWAEELEDIRVNRPLFMQTSLFKQWYLNQWCIDESARVYRFSAARNVCKALPQDVSGWHYVLGLDLAHSPDSTAFVVGAYHESLPVLFLVYSFKAIEMDLTDVALHIHLLEKTYAFDVKVVDGANKQAVSELNNRHDLNLICADKTGKVDFITIMNDDFIQAKIMLLEEETKDLQTEYDKLIWLTDANGKVLIPKKENPIIHNDLSDGALYLWRYCYVYLDVFDTGKKWINPHDQSQWEPEHVRKLQEQVKKEQNPNYLEIVWDEEWDEDQQFNGG